MTGGELALQLSNSGCGLDAASNFGGESPSVIKFPGDPEPVKAGTFFAQSFVLWLADVAIAADDSASNNGEVTGKPFDACEAAGFISGD